MTFSNYYNEQFKIDLLNFIEQIPVESKNCLSETEVTIQYFTLTPAYRYLDIIPKERQKLFAVSLLWTVLIDQIFHHLFKYAKINSYEEFSQKHQSPKFIANQPAMENSLRIKHLHPAQILKAINNIENESFINDERFANDRAKTVREYIGLHDTLGNSLNPMKQILFDKNTMFDTRKHRRIYSFWEKCIENLPIDSSTKRKYCFYKYLYGHNIVRYLDFEYVHVYSLLREGDISTKEFYENREKEGKLDWSAAFNGKTEYDKLLFMGSKTLLTQTGEFHRTAKCTHIFHWNDPKMKELEKILQNLYLGNSINYWGGLCRRIYRDAIVFYKRNGTISFILNVCLSCQHLEDDRNNDIEKYVEDFSEISDFFISLHQSASPTCLFNV